MSTSEKDRCQRCGAVIPATSTEKICPACLMSGALEPPSGEAKTVSMASSESLSLFGPSEFPCEFGGYRLLGLLGRGGMGTVYEAEQLATGRRVALKMLAQQLDSPEMRQRFLREGRLAAGVNHPNSLYIFGSEEIEGLPVITMEIASSGTLKDNIKKHGPLSVTEAVDAVLDIISGLEAAFARGVLHRDIKPSNCFICPEGSVKVGDFGLSVSMLAKTDTFVTAHGKILGTPAYASPEQLRGDTLDMRADIYSVGATLFTLLTDRAPFEGDNAVQVVANAVNQKPKPLCEFRNDVPPGLDHVWITVQGHTVLLDEPWPRVQTGAERIPVGDVAGQHRFLNTVAACVESTSLPLHTRGVLQNLADGKFEKLSFLTGILRGLLDKPAQVSKGIRAGSILMMPVYVWILVFVGVYRGGGNQQWIDSLGWLVMISAIMVLGTIALIQLVELPLFRTTASHAIFRLAVVNTKGQRANILTLLRRWAIVWLPLFIPMLIVGMLTKEAELIALICAVLLLGLWIGAAVYAVIHPHRGLHDRLAGTWVIRQ